MSSTSAAKRSLPRTDRSPRPRLTERCSIGAIARSGCRMTSARAYSHDGHQSDRRWHGGGSAPDRLDGSQAVEPHAASPKRLFCRRFVQHSLQPLAWNTRALETTAVRNQAQSGWLTRNRADPVTRILAQARVAARRATRDDGSRADRCHVSASGAAPSMARSLRQCGSTVTTTVEQASSRWVFYTG
jgi:hypothetical protein